MPRACTGCWVLLLALWLSLLCWGQDCSPDVGVEALRVGFFQAPLSLSVCPAPKEVTAESSEAHVVIVNLCAPVQASVSLP